MLGIEIGEERTVGIVELPPLCLVIISANPKARIRKAASELPTNQRLRLSRRASFIRASGSMITVVLGLGGDNAISTLVI